jgi:predicted transcriptional regulator
MEKCWNIRSRRNFSVFSDTLSVFKDTKNILIRYFKLLNFETEKSLKGGIAMALKISGKKRFKGLITEDGEVVYLDFMINAFIPRTPKDKEPYTKVYGEKLLHLIKQKKLKASELEVFLWFVAKNSNKDSWNNEWITVDYEELAKELGISLITVKRAIKTLLKLKLIVQWRPRKTAFRLNPDYCFRGGVVSKKQVKQEIANAEYERKVEKWKEEDN